NGAEPITIEGSGRYQGEAFSLDVGVGSPLRLLEEGRPYPIEVRAEVAKTTARIKGEVTQPLDIKGLNLVAAIKGPNPSRLEKLVGQPLPDLPPYEMKGEVSREGAIWRLNNFAGQVGASDLSGDVSVRTLRDPRPLVVADLKSRQLNLDDFSGRSGAAPDTRKGETKSAGQQQKAKTDAKAKTVLPRDEIDLSTLRVVDAKVSFNGKQIEIGLPINDLRVKGNLHDGRLALKPLNFGVLGGSIKSRLRLDGSARPIEAQMTTDVSRVDLKKILRGSGFAHESVGNIGGRANLTATGDSVADLMATLDGPLSLIMTGGKLDSLLIELAGLDLMQTLGDFLGDDEAVPIHCAFIDLHSRQGQVDVKTFVIDTTDTRFSGDGEIDLDKERIKFVIAPHPKDFSLLSFPTPLHVVGGFSNLSFDLGDSEPGKQSATDVALELVESPFAGLIQLADTRAGQSAACRPLLKETENEARTVTNDAGTVKSNSDRKGGEKKAPPSPETFIKSDPLQ
ncbi:MAG: AsmA family protein, partial [Pseudomonadota bacterium]|nr:AsmA family protein [Pseudomonadota bacterium]